MKNAVAILTAIAVSFISENAYANRPRHRSRRCCAACQPSKVVYRTVYQQVIGRDDLHPTQATNQARTLTLNHVKSIGGINANLLFVGIQNALARAGYSMDLSYGPHGEPEDAHDLNTVWARTVWHSLPNKKSEIRHYARGRILTDGGEDFELRVYTQIRDRSTKEYFTAPDTTVEAALKSLIDWLKQG